MEITGKIIFALERRAGKSARTGNDWASQSYVLETRKMPSARRIKRNNFTTGIGNKKIASLAVREKRLEI